MKAPKHLGNAKEVTTCGNCIDQRKALFYSKSYLATILLSLINVHLSLLVKPVKL